MTGQSRSQVLGSDSILEDALRFHDLGPLVVEVGGQQVPIGGMKLARTLATLLVNVNRRVSADVLKVAVWGDRVRRDGASIESHIWRLRKLLEPNRPPRGSSAFLVNDVGGYRLVVNPDQADSLRYAQLADQGDDLLMSGDLGRALGCYDAALRLWRGWPFEVLADDESSMAAIGRLEQLHAHVQEQRVEVLLRLGQLTTALASVEELVARFPLRERLWEQLMLALYRAGRAGEALNAYLRAREVLLDDVGVEPGPELRQLQQRILDQDPALNSSPAAPGPAPAAVGAVPLKVGLSVHLPVRLAPLVGRDNELDRLMTLLGRNRLLTIVGAAGCGKTRLAIEVARASAPASRDGVWFVDLTAVKNATEVATVVASTIGVAPGVVGGVLTSLSSYVQDRQILLVLDNCEHVLAGARRVCDQLLGEGSQCRVLATSREPIGIDGEVLWTLAPLNVYRGDENPPVRSDAARLFWSKVESVAPQFEITATAQAQVERICAAVDGIPLGIELAAGRIRGNSLSELVRQVQDGLGDLSRIGDHGLDHHRTIEQSIEWSVRMLSEAERVVHARLSVLPGIFTAEAAVAVAGFEPVAAGQIPTVLQQLLNRSLLGAVAPVDPDQPTRFRQLATVRAHADLALAATGDAEEVTQRRTTWVSGLLESRPTIGAADTNGWYQQVENNHDTVVAELERALVDHPGASGVHLTGQLSAYWWYRNRFLEGERWAELALSRRDAVRIDRVETQLSLAGLLSLRDRIDLSRRILLEVSAHAEQTELRSLMMGLMSCAFVAWTRQDPSVELFVNEVRARVPSADSLVNLYGDTAKLLGDLPRVGPVLTHDRAAELMVRALGQDATWLAFLLASIRVACLMETGDGPRAAGVADEAVSLHLSMGATMNPILHEMQGNVAVLSGHVEHGLRLLGAARAAGFRAGAPWPFLPMTPVFLVAARQQLSPDQFEHAWRDGTTPPDPH